MYKQQSLLCFQHLLESCFCLVLYTEVNLQTFNMNYNFVITTFVEKCFILIIGFQKFEYFHFFPFIVKMAQIVQKKKKKKKKKK